MNYEECEKANCEHGCVVQAGRTQCTCRDGYTLAIDKMTCLGKFAFILCNTVTKAKPYTKPNKLSLIL